MKKILNKECVESKNQLSLNNFTEYCIKHPEERFWQALRNWSGSSFIMKMEDGVMIDTFYDK